MKRVLLLLCLIGAVGSTSTTLHRIGALNLQADDAMSKATSSSHPSVQSTEIVDLQSEQDEVHAVVVDMPRVISLSYASPDTWGDLPMSDRPYEQPPATGPAQQLAMSLVRLSVSN